MTQRPVTPGRFVRVDGPRDPRFWDPGNHQPLCKSCHSHKTATEDGRWGWGPNAQGLQTMPDLGIREVGDGLLTVPPWCGSRVVVFSDRFVCDQAPARSCALDPSWIWKRKRKPLDHVVTE